MTPTTSRTPRRPIALAAFLAFASLLSCGREITGPGNGIHGRTATVAFAPRFALSSANGATGVDLLAHQFSDLVPFEKVRIILRRGDEIIFNRLIDFPASADSVALKATITLGPDATSEGETLSATLDYLNSDDVVVFSGGPIDVIARPGNPSAGQAVEIALDHVGPGSGGVFLVFDPDSLVGLMGDTLVFTSESYDNQESFVEDAVILHTSRDTLVARVVNAGEPRVRLVGARGRTWIIAQLFDGAIDSAQAIITPTAASLVIASGNGQQALEGNAFATPLRVQVRAADNLGVEGWPVTFTVTSGQGTFDSTEVIVEDHGIALLDVTEVLTDADGFAEITWIAGDSVGLATVTASIANPALNVVFNGTQLSSSATSLGFLTQPTNITAGVDLPAITVEVRNGAGQVITDFVGFIDLSLTGGNASGALVGGTVSVEAVAGVATFENLTVDRGGAGYRLVANIEGLSAQSNVFNVAAAPATTLALISGGGQSALAEAPLSDSIIFRLTDEFGYGVPSVPVTVVGILGGGSVSPVAPVTDAAGYAAVQWTLGTAGPQQITAFVTGLTIVNVSATVFTGGAATLFAGYDYTYVPTGGSRTIPIFLSAPSATETWVQLTAGNPAVATWALDSVLFTPGMTQLGVQVNGVSVGEAFVYLASALGNDSVFIDSDSAAVEFQYLDRNTITVGDTLRMLVRLTHPAPPGGVTVVVRSGDPVHFLVAPGTGGGVPATGCFYGGYCGGDLRAVDGTPALTATPADTAALFIAEGAITAQLAVIAVTGTGFTSTSLTAEAPGYASNQSGINSQLDDLNLYASDATFSEPIGEGQLTHGYVQRNNSSQSRDLEVTLTSRDEESFTVDSIVRIVRGESYSTDFVIKAHVAGSAYLVFESAGYAADSVLITVGASAVRLLAPDGEFVSLGHSGFLYVGAGAAGSFYDFEVQTPLNVSFQVEGDTVIALDAMSTVLRVGEQTRGIGYRVIGPGDARVIAFAAGHLPDTVSFTTEIGFMQLHTGAPNAGVGQFAEVAFGLPGNLRSLGTTTVTATSQDPGIARILTQTVEITQGSFSSLLLIEGVSEGSVTIVLSAPNFNNLEFTFTVTAPGLLLSNYSGTWAPDSVTRLISAFAFSAGSGTRGVMDTVRAVLRSSDPSVVDVPDSVVIFLPGSSQSNDGTWRTVGPGTADLTLEAPGYPPSEARTIIVGQYELVVGSSWANVGQGLSTFLSVARNSPTGAPLPITITQTGPGNIELPVGGDTLPPGFAVHGLAVHGLTVGVDTLIFSAAGHKSDTLVIGVVPAEVHLTLNELFPRVGFVDEFVFALLSHSGSLSGFSSPIEKRLVLTSVDTSVAKVLQDTLVFAAGDSDPSQYGSVQYTGIGLAQFVISDADSLFPPDTVQIFVEPRDIVGPEYDGTSVNTMAMGQQTSDYEFFVGPYLPLATPTVFYLKSSDTSVVQVPDSVIVPAYYPFENVTLTARNKIGSARISASAPGWNEFEYDVAVTRGETVLFASDTYVGSQSYAELYIVDAISKNSRPMASPQTLRIKTDRPEIADAGAATFEFPAGQNSMSTGGPAGISVGQTLVQVEDTLPVGDAQKLLSEATQMSVHRRDLYVPADRKIIGRGLQSPMTYAFAYGISDSVWVHFQSLGGKFSLDTDSVYIGRASFEDYAEMGFQLTGLTLGADTLVISADGFDSDSTLIEIHTGVLLMEQNVTAPTVQIGDSTLVTLTLLDGAGIQATATDVLTINFSTDTLLAVSDGAGDVATMNINPTATTVSFWVRGLQTGQSELVVTSSDFRTFRFVFTVRPQPGE